MTEAVARQTLSAKKYRFVRKDDDGNLIFHGEVFGDSASVLLFMNNSSQLAKVAVIIITPDEDARRTYDNLKRSLIAKYGEPTDDFHFFSSPYEENDGYELTAFRVGKATFASYWHPGPGKNVPVSIDITQRLNVEVTYEGPGWTEESARRRAKAAKDF